MSVKYEDATSFDSVYKEAQDFIQGHIDYYGGRIGCRRKASWIIRGLVLLSLAVGVLLPILAAALPDAASDPSKFELSLWGYYAIVFGGLIFAVDQTFLISKSWMRFTVTMITLEDILKDFEAAWGQAFYSAGQKTEDNFPNALSLQSEYKDKAQDQVVQETNQWVQDLTAAMTSMEQRIARHEKKLETKLEALIIERTAQIDAQAKSVLPGAIRVNFKQPNSYDGQITVSLEGPEARTAKVPAETEKHAFGNLPPGVYSITIEAGLKQENGSVRGVSNSDVVTLAAGDKEDVNF